MKYIKLIWLIICLMTMNGISLYAQNSFYEHYTGLISEELKLTADLVKVKEGFSGYYYYEFLEEGAWISSKPIPLDGFLDDKNQFVLNEFGDQNSFFQGRLENAKLIKGQWVNNALKENIDFTLKATYAQGSIPLQLVEKYQAKSLKGQMEPQAEFNLVLLFPEGQLDPAAHHQLNRRIYQLIGYRGEFEPNENRINTLEESYFRQFENAMTQVSIDSFPDHLSWQKSIRMDVINNESSLLCMQIDMYAKTGKQEGTRVKKYIVFDLVENKLLGISDFINPEHGAEFQAFLDQKLREHYKLHATTSLTELGFFNNEMKPTSNFYIHPGGLGFYYNIFEIAPFSNGPTDLFIPWSEMAPFLLDPHPFGVFIN